MKSGEHPPLIRHVLWGTWVGKGSIHAKWTKACGDQVTDVVQNL